MVLVKEYTSRFPLFFYFFSARYEFLSSLSSSVLRRIDECKNRTPTRAYNNIYFVFSLIDSLCQCHWHAIISWSNSLVKRLSIASALACYPLFSSFSLSLSICFFLSFSFLASHINVVFLLVLCWCER